MLKNKNILIIDDDHDVAESYDHLLTTSGYQVLALTDPTQVMDHLYKDWAGVVICNVYMPAMNGLDLLDKIQQLDPTLPVIIITGHADIPLAINAVKQGAIEFFQKPLQPQALLDNLSVLLPRRQTIINNRQRHQKKITDILIGNSPLITKIREQLKSALINGNDVLIEGEMGTGRHTISHLLHQEFPTVTKRIFININSAELKYTTDLEQSLISAEAGDICLHNPQKMPISVQQWLCEYLINLKRTNRKHVRVIAIVDGQASDFVEQHTLVPELFYLLSQTRFSMPTLRQRNVDILPLFRHFLTLSCKTLDKPIPQIDKSYSDILFRYSWPNNVLELKSVAELYAIGIVKLTGHERHKSYEQMSRPLEDLLDNYEKKIIEDALFLFSGRISEVAEYLHIPRKKLYLRMQKHQLDKAQYKPT